VSPLTERLEHIYLVPQVSPGLRSLDEYELTGHYDKWREDLDLAAPREPP
jgi:hypothetical protein